MTPGSLSHFTRNGPGTPQIVKSSEILQINRGHPKGIGRWQEFRPSEFRE